MSRESDAADIVSYWLEKASESLASARDELSAGRHSFSVNRCYYSAFYAASAVLLAHGHRFRKHAGVRAALHKHFIKPGLLSTEQGRIYDRLFHDRQEGDYLEFIEFTYDELVDMIANAEELLEALEGLAEPDPGATTP